MTATPPNNDRQYRLFAVIAMALAVLSLCLLGYEYFAAKKPGEMNYQAGNSYFNDKRYAKAKAAYLEALEENPDLAAAYGGLANTMVQMRDFREGLRFINEAIELAPDFGGYYATRGILHDHLGAYEKAISDYETALRLYPQVSEGMGWIDRFFNKLESAPPTVADRLSYLKAQMKLPPSKRLLRVPLIDDEQKPYEQ